MPMQSSFLVESVLPSEEVRSSLTKVNTDSSLLDIIHHMCSTAKVKALFDRTMVLSFSTNT
jgi:hypothetical protein